MGSLFRRGQTQVLSLVKSSDCALGSGRHTYSALKPGRAAGWAALSARLLAVRCCPERLLAGSGGASGGFPAVVWV